MNMFNRHSSFMKFSGLIALAAFSFTTLQTKPARAYNYNTHSRIAELAGERWTPIDEQQGILADFGDDWPAIVAAARRFEVTP